MPIRPENRYFYPIDWVQLSVAIRFGRAKGVCETCGRPHGRVVTHLGDGRWWDEEATSWRNSRGRRLKLASPENLPAGLTLRTTRVVLACAHLDHDVGNNDPSNLRALCQRCHILHDRNEHLRQRWYTYRLRWAMGDLFLGPYPFRAQHLPFVDGLGLPRRAVETKAVAGPKRTVPTQKLAVNGAPVGTGVDEWQEF